MTNEKIPEIPPQAAQRVETDSTGGENAAGQRTETVTQNHGSSIQPILPPGPRSDRATRSSKRGKGLTRPRNRKSKGRHKAACIAGKAAIGANRTPESSNRTSGNRHDWDAIRARYIIGNEDLRELAEKIPCSLTTLGKRSAREGWPKLREEYRYKVGTETVQKATIEVATERAKIARIAVGAMGALSIKWKRVLWKMENKPPDEWEKDPEIAKLSPADYERLVKSYLLLMGEATERHEYKEQIAPETAEAIWRIMAEEQEREQGKGQESNGI